MLWSDHDVDPAKRNQIFQSLDNKCSSFQDIVNHRLLDVKQLSFLHPQLSVSLCVHTDILTLGTASLKLLNPGNDGRCSTTCLCLGKPIYVDPSKCPSSISSPASGWLSGTAELSGTDGASWGAGLRMGTDSALGRSNSTGTVLQGEKSKQCLSFFRRMGSFLIYPPFLLGLDHSSIWPTPLSVGPSTLQE